MSIELDGIKYVPTSELLEHLEISRQTLWRWRSTGKIPQGHRFRNGQLLFTLDEVDAIAAYSKHVEPIGSGNEQLGLFSQRDS